MRRAAGSDAEAASESESDQLIKDLRSDGMGKLGGSEGMAGGGRGKPVVCSKVDPAVPESLVGAGLFIGAGS